VIAVGPRDSELIQRKATVLGNLRVALRDLLQAACLFQLSILGMVGKLGRGDLDGNVLGWLALSDTAQPD
jgi:hypothetical protein